MPEGPEIKRAADRIAKAVARKPIEEVYFAFEHLKPYEKDLARAQITSVQPRGKALLTHFNNDLAIYTHNQLYGKWEIKRARNYPETK
ncbi:MAG: DNA-formamidopyrimidine glycosylase family protein, partial [Cyanobacteria bacterium P01_E01_bin.48]